MKRIGLLLFLVIPALLLVAPAVSAHGNGGGGGGGEGPAKCTQPGDGNGHGHHGHDHGHGNGDDHCKNHGHGHGNGGGDDGQGVEYAATAADAMPGGSMLLHADVTNADTTVPLTVSATVHLAAVDVTVPLTVVAGKNAYAADGAAGVGGEEPPETVNVDFTFDYGGTSTTVTVQAHVAFPTP